MRCARCVPSISAAPGSSTSDANQKSGRPTRDARFFHRAEFSTRPGRQPVPSPISALSSRRESRSGAENPAPSGFHLRLTGLRLSPCSRTAKSGRPSRDARFFPRAEVSTRPGRHPVPSLPDSCAVLPPGVPVLGGKSCPVRLPSALARPPAEPLPPHRKKRTPHPGRPLFFIGRSFPPLSPFPPENRGGCYRSITASQQR